MNLNEIWNTFQAIYGKAAPVFFVMIIVLPIIIWCFPNASFKRFWQEFSFRIFVINSSRKVKTYSEFLNKFKLNVLIPVVFVIASIWGFVFISDVFEAVANYTFDSSWKDLLIEQEPPYDLVVFSTMLAVNLDTSKIKSYTYKESNLVLDTLKSIYLKNEKSNNKDSIILSSIYNFYASESYRLTNKYPERYGSIVDQCEMNVSKHRTRFGGFFVVACSIFCMLTISIYRAKKPKWIKISLTIIALLIVMIACTFIILHWKFWKWLLFLSVFVILIILFNKYKYFRNAKISVWRALIIFLIVSALAFRYRLHWEWAYENETIVRSRISALTLQEEKHINNVSKSLQFSLDSLQKEYQPEKFWLARSWDLITVKFLNTTYRPVKYNTHYWR
jgi:hypothetical protein